MAKDVSVTTFGVEQIFQNTGTLPSSHVRIVFGEKITVGPAVLCFMEIHCFAALICEAN